MAPNVWVIGNRVGRNFQSKATLYEGKGHPMLGIHNLTYVIFGI
jgi:hypothetical protein